MTEGQSLKLLLQDPRRGDEKRERAELRRFDERVSGASGAPESSGSEAPSLYKFKINMNDLLEQVAKNDPNAGRNPDQDEIDEQKAQLEGILNDKLKQVEGILAKLAEFGHGAEGSSLEESTFNAEVQEMRDRAARLKQELQDKVKKLGEAEELVDLAALRDEITPLGEEVDTLEKDVDGLLQANTGARLNAMADRLAQLQGSLSQLTTNAQQKLEEYQALISEAQAHSQDDPSFLEQLAKLEAEAKAIEAEIVELKARAAAASLRQEEILATLNDAKATDEALTSDKLEALSAGIDSLEQETAVLQESDQRITADLEQRIKDFQLLAAENERAKANA